MKMDKLFAGLIAFVAGVALSAGSAAANGYMTGDPAMMKLVPYFETGDNKATIIGIQNMSPQEDATVALHTTVAAAQKNLDDDPGTDLQDTADLEKALADAQKAVHTEHVFVDVNVYDAMGMMMDNASATLCLAEGQFGYVVLQGSADMGMDSHQGAVLSVMDGDIPAYGYVQVMAGSEKYTSCVGDARTGLTSVTLNEAMAQSTIAAWTIIQDTGSGFFGTEVPTATISMMADDPATTDVDESKTFDCYNNNEFDMASCGLIPTGDTAIARYDAGDESMVYVWLAAGQDDKNTHPRNSRTLDVTVTCEDGSKHTGMDEYGDPTDSIKVPAPGMVTMIDPTMGPVGDNTAMCAGDRGVLEIMLPVDDPDTKGTVEGVHAAMVFTHVTQMGGHYRMNFPGYSMTPTK